MRRELPDRVLPMLPILSSIIVGQAGRNTVDTRSSRAKGSVTTAACTWSMLARAMRGTSVAALARRRHPLGAGLGGGSSDAAAAAAVRSRSTATPLHRKRCGSLSTI